MEKEFLIKCIDKDMSLSQIAKVMERAPSTVTYWLTKFELKTNHKSFKDGGSKIEYSNGKTCPRCMEIKPTDEFYQC
jgi:hypothetical protein